MKETTNRPEQRARMSKRFSGAGSNFWQGGITADNERLRRGSQFRAWRRAVFQRDGYTCQQCGLIGGPLHPHHVKAWALFPELRFDVANGQTLCVDCHRQTDNYSHRGNRPRARSPTKD